MLNQNDFENIVWDFLFSYRQFLLNGILHKRVDSESYKRNPATWNVFLLSTESGTILGLERLLEREKDLGRAFGDANLDSIVKKVKELRDKYIAHSDLSKIRSTDFLEENRLSGTEIINIFDALKNRLIRYQTSHGFTIEVDKLFRMTTRNAVTDLDSWLKSFKVEL